MPSVNLIFNHVKDGEFFVTACALATWGEVRVDEEEVVLSLFL